jgi:DNA repair protein RadC
MQISHHIKNWAEEDQPIFKMLQKGAKYLSDAELMQLLNGKL